MASYTVTLLVAYVMFSAMVLADDVVVLLKTSEAVDVQVLKCVHGTAAVYKVKSIHFHTTSVYRGKRTSSALRRFHLQQFVCHLEIRIRIYHQAISSYEKEKKCV